MQSTDRFLEFIAWKVSRWSHTQHRAASTEYSWTTGCKGKGIKVVVYEPTLQEETFFNSQVINDLDTFKKTADLIIANRMTEELEDVREKIYTRDLFGGDS